MNTGEKKIHNFKDITNFRFEVVRGLHNLASLQRGLDRFKHMCIMCH